MKKNSISINGFSTSSGLLSLLLADKGVRHKFNVLEEHNSFLDLPPISNPIVNFKAQQIERNFIQSKYLEDVIEINSYNYAWYDKQYNKILHLKGKYKYPLYAIDNRIRYKLFWDKINEKEHVEIVKYETNEELISSTNAQLNFIGGGSKFNYLFEDFKQLKLSKNDKNSKTLFYFNLDAPKEILEKYATSTALYLDGNDYIIIYTSMHLFKKNVLTIVVNSNIFDNCCNILQKFENIKYFILEIDSLIAKDLKKCELIPENYFFGSFNSYFKEPTSNSNLIGLGDTIIKVNPITGKGYNCSAQMMNKLALIILKAKSIDDILDNYNIYASEKISELYHLNLAFTKNQYNTSVTPVLVEAMNNKNLRNFAIAETYENTSLYFPWLINEKASQMLIQDFSETTWYQSILRFLFQKRKDVK